MNLLLSSILVLLIWLMIRIRRRNDSRLAKSFRPSLPPFVPWALQLPNLLKCLEMIRKVERGGVSAIRTVISFTGGGDASVQADLVGSVRGAPGRRTGLGGGLAPLRGGGRGRGRAGKEGGPDPNIASNPATAFHFLIQI